jgi:hypothetical protein
MISLEGSYTVQSSEGFPLMYTSEGALLSLMSLGSLGEWNSQERGFQYGWSTVCNRKNASQMLLDARIIKFVYDNFIANGRGRVDLLPEDECVTVRDFLKTVGIEGEYAGTMGSLTIEKFPNWCHEIDVGANGAEWFLPADW